MKILIYILSSFCLMHISIAQTDSIFDAYQKDFESFKDVSDEEFQAFKQETDSNFVKFLQHAWKEFEVFREIQPIRPKPKNQPVIEQKSDSIKEQNEVETETIPILKKINQEKEDTELGQVAPKGLGTSSILKSVDFFGNKINISYYPDKLPHLKKVDEASISLFYEELEKTNIVWNYNLERIDKIKKANHFNDWGYYLLLSAASKTVFTKENEQILFVWYLMMKKGYQIKVGFEHGAIFLLMPTEQELYNLKFLTLNGIKYYLLNSTHLPLNQITTYAGYYNEQSKIFSFALSQLPTFKNGSLKYRKIRYNQMEVLLKFDAFQIDFLDSYPQCELKTYFEAPVTSSIFNELSEILTPLMEGKSDIEKLNILLNFVQTAFAYQTDEKQFGQERYMFAEECLYYPYSDCEDRSALLGQLVKHFTHLPTVGLEFAEHVTLAVQFTNGGSGNFVSYHGKKYYICDATYVHAKSGMLPDHLKNEKPQIIEF